MKTVLAILFVLFAPLGTRAQNPIKVRVGGNSGVGDIVEQLKARIGGTSRYELDDDAAASVSVDVDCIPLHLENETTRTGYACDSEVFYFPDMGALDTQLSDAETLVTCPTDGVFCVQSLFDHFVTGTQPEKLKEAKARLKSFVDSYVRARKEEK